MNSELTSRHTRLLVHIYFAGASTLWHYTLSHPFTAVHGRDARASVLGKWILWRISVEYGRVLPHAGVTSNPCIPSISTYRHQVYSQGGQLHASANTVGESIAAEYGRETEALDPRAVMRCIKTATMSFFLLAKRQADIHSLPSQPCLSLSKSRILPSNHPKSAKMGTKASTHAKRPFQRDIRAAKALAHSQKT